MIAQQHADDVEHGKIVEDIVEYVIEPVLPSEFLDPKPDFHINATGRFVIGGPYGFSKDVYKKANGKISLSKMTFSHQMVRLFFIEQLYRGFTILKNEPYHHN